MYEDDNIEIKEMLGNEQILYFSANSCSCAATIPPSLKVEKEFTFKINTNNVLLFDSETGQRI